MTEEMSLEEYNHLLTSQKVSKYRNRRVQDPESGRWFDSQAEYKRYLELLILLKDGQIERLTLQPAYTIFPGFRDNTGKKQRAIIYKADFSYIEVLTGQSIAEDVKGMATALFLMKRKMFLKSHPEVELRIIQA